ncbi:hypothetical protein OC861_000483 [Tilletia horrida]|nr:hypothetical protein OC861_000483 [Tilletia horrida]
MAATASNAQRDTLAHRLSADDTLLHVTMASSEFESALGKSISLDASKDGKSASIDKFAVSEAYATVPISIQPGTGNNLVHQRYSGNITNPPNNLCAATARLLDLQTLLELPLAVLGILLQNEQEKKPPHRTYLWPDKSKVDKIQVVRLPREGTRNSPPEVTLLALEDLAGTVWDFVQPERYTSVIIHIQTVSATPQPLRDGCLQQLLAEEWTRCRRKEPSGRPRDSQFKARIKPTNCVITGASSDVAEGAHIIARCLELDLVNDVVLLLFGTDSPSRGETGITPLFHRQRKAYVKTVDDSDNGILLSPTLHTIIRDEKEEKELWKEQLLHEGQVVPVRCPRLSPTQECLLHLAAVLSFFFLFMKDRRLVSAAFAHLDDQSVSDKKQKTAQSDSHSEGAPPGSTGTRAAEGLPANRDDDTDGLSSKRDSNSRCEEESDWDEDEERRWELLYNDTLALRIMKQTLAPGAEQLCV